MADPKITWEGTRVGVVSKALLNPLKILKAWALLWVRATQDGFKAQKRGPFAWAPRMSPNIPGMLRDFERGPNVPKRRFEARPALMDTGMLKKSYAWSNRDSKSILVGTNIPYANLHQFGGKVKIKITQTMRENLSTWMKREGGRSGRVMTGEKPGPGASKAEKKAYRDRMKANKATASSGLSDKFGWLFNTDVYEFTVRARPHVIFSDGDRASLNTMIRKAIDGALPA